MFFLSFHPSFLLLFLLIIPRTLTAAESPAYTAADLILLNCGASSNSNDTSNRIWDADSHSRYVPPNAANISLASEASFMEPSVSESVPYKTARVFRSKFTYSFPVSIGHKFIRLYFYPGTFPGVDATQSFFSVSANGFTLLSHFNPFLNSWHTPNGPSFRKEFLIYVEGYQKIYLTFSPNPNSCAFVNGIEIVSLPDDLHFRSNQIKVVPDLFYYLPNDTALETLYRLNMGGGDDSGPAWVMFGFWENDDGYTTFGPYGYTPQDETHNISYTAETPPYSGPKIVYRTSKVISNGSKSLDWAFPVDSGFSYLLRFHFCEIRQEITKQNPRVFTLQINNEKAENQADVIFWTGGNGIPIFRDYITHVNDDNGRHEKKDLRVSLFPNNDGSPMYSNALLIGLEVLKLSDLKNGLAAVNPDPLQAPKWKKNSASVLLIVIGSILGVLVGAVGVSFSIFWSRLKMRISCAKESLGPKMQTHGLGRSPLLSDFCRHFSLKEIIKATNNFNDNYLIGKGGFGNVYKGLLSDGDTPVAVKRLHASSNQGAQEFLTEIELLSKLRHLHLVSLIGYCNESGEMILVYDYMVHGTLREHLYNSNNPPLTWKHRLQICLGAAKGLHYLHTGTKQAIIHRDIKSTNILLDDRWVAKVSDFGLSKVGPTDASNTHVSTVVKGSFGYLDPEYYRRQQLTNKSDVYSFGVVLLEVLCARPAVLPSSLEYDDQVNLAEWAKCCYRGGTIYEILDPNLEDQIVPECLTKFVETAMKCLTGNRMKRPGMSEVIRSLEITMQLQEGGGPADHGDSVVSASPAFQYLGYVELNSLSEVEMVSRATESVSASRNSGLQSTQEGWVC